MAIFVTAKARNVLFQQAEKQNITLFKGENLEILAVPIEWALERKLRRIHTGSRGPKGEADISDAVACLKHLRDRNKGLLEMESTRTMNLNGFDILPDHITREKIAKAYRDKHNEEIFK